MIDREAVGRKNRTGKSFHCSSALAEQDFQAEIEVMIKNILYVKMI